MKHMEPGDVVKTMFGDMIFVDRYVQDNDLGDEDQSERTPWTVILRHSVVAPHAVHQIQIVGKVSF